MKLVIYARYSSDLQNSRSIDDQCGFAVNSYEPMEKALRMTLDALMDSRPFERVMGMDHNAVKKHAAAIEAVNNALKVVEGQ
jgi:hypothetical protein